MRELRRHIDMPFQTWASLQGIDPSYGRFFDHVVVQGGDHAGKLNHLALEITQHAGDDDLLMFLDGDAFPIADPASLICSGLATAPLMAVRRTENVGDPQPHPCFCVTRISTWRDLGGDWSAGYTWLNEDGEPMSDVGANLLRRLELTATPWSQVLRSNRHEMHPLFFGIYGDALYHHGAGFREPLARVDYAALRSKEVPGSKWSTRLAKRRLINRNRRNSERLFERLKRDDAGWLTDVGAQSAGREHAGTL